MAARFCIPTICKVAVLTLCFTLVYGGFHSKTELICQMMINLPCKGSSISLMIDNCPNPRNYSIKKAASDADCVTVDKQCRETTPVKADDSCILYKRKNIAVKKTGLTLIQLPVTLKTGMKMIVYAGTLRNAKSSQFTITKDAKHPNNILKWFHIIFIWSTGRTSFNEGISMKYLNRLPVSDKTNFTLTFELAQLETKIFADKALLKRTEAISELVEFSVREYNRIHKLVIQKMDEDCE